MGEITERRNEGPERSVMHYVRGFVALLLILFVAGCASEPPPPSTPPVAPSASASPTAHTPSVPSVAVTPTAHPTAPSPTVPIDIVGPITLHCAARVVPGHCLQPVAWAIAHLPPGLASVASVTIMDIDLCPPATPGASPCFPLHYSEWWASFTLSDGSAVGTWVANSFGLDEVKSVAIGATPPPSAQPVSGTFWLVCGSIPDQVCTGAAGGSTDLSPNKPPQTVRVEPTTTRCDSRGRC